MEMIANSCAGIEFGLFGYGFVRTRLTNGR